MQTLFYRCDYKKRLIKDENAFTNVDPFLSFRGTTQAYLESTFKMEQAEKLTDPKKISDAFNTFFFCRYWTKISI